MRKWFLILIMAILPMFPSLASAQSDITLTSVNVQLWPEYDQPSMLVIVDYTVPTDTKLPIDVTFRIPQEANLVAVASYSPEGALINASFGDPKLEGEWQVFTVALDSMQGHFEYYQPLIFTGEQRTFSYVWNGIYAVDAFNISVLEPLDTTSLSASPELDVTSLDQGLKFRSRKPFKLAANEQFALKLEYQKTSSALVSSSPAVQPSAPLDENTSGRASFSNYLPYIIGGLGIIMMVGGFFYYSQAGKTGTKKPRRRVSAKPDEQADGEVYCSQCGSRARGGDRFCRTCGSRIKQQED